MSSSNRAKAGPTPKRDAVRRQRTAQRRADLSGTAPWAFRVPDAAPRSQEAAAMAHGRTHTRLMTRRAG